MTARKSTTRKASPTKKAAPRRRVATHLTDSSLKALGRLVRSKTPKSIANALNFVVVPYLDPPIAQLGELARMLRVLFILDVEVSVHGIRRFFWTWPNGFDGGDEGGYASEAAQFCDRIGARRAAAYLREGVAMFPGGVSDLDGLPVTLREVVLTRMFLLDVETSGSWKFLEHLESGAQLRQFAAMCDRVGASKAAAYVRAMPKVFPRGRFPDDADERDDILMELDARPGGDPLRALDRAYAGATQELVAAYRRHVAADPAAYEKRMAG